MAERGTDARNFSMDSLSGFLEAIDVGLLPGAELPLDESNTYRWNGATMGQRIGEVLPVIYGRHIVTPNLINAFIEEGEYETLNMLLAWCEFHLERRAGLFRQPVLNHALDEPPAADAKPPLLQREEEPHHARRPLAG